jgi:hypothetical protein
MSKKKGRSNKIVPWIFLVGSLGLSASRSISARRRLIRSFLGHGLQFLPAFYIHLAHQRQSALYVGVALALLLNKEGR